MPAVPETGGPVIELRLDKSGTRDLEQRRFTFEGFLTLAVGVAYVCAFEGGFHVVG